MFLKQIPNDETGCLSYIGYCASCGVGYAIDPLENIEPYLKIAKDNDIQITHIFNTHIQADHISGDRKLAEKTGAKIYMHDSANVSYPFERLKEGNVISIGNPKLKVLHTPGHTPESMSLLVAEYPGTSEGIIFTGDTLLRGNVGRLDLDGAGTPEQLYESVKKLLALEDYVAVMPNHYGKSQCGVGLSSVPISTIGYEKRFNGAIYALSDRQKFIDYIKALKTMEIPDYHKIKRINMDKQKN